MPFTVNYANNILNWLFAKSTLTPPSSIYIGFCSNDPEEDNGSINELSGNGYSRVLLSLKGESYPNTMGVASNRAIKNTYQINWTKATGDWVEAKGFFIADALTGGNILFYGKLKEPMTCSAGSVALFDPYALSIGFGKVDSTSEASVSE